MDIGSILFFIGLFVMIGSWGFKNAGLGTIIGILLIAIGLYLGSETGSGESFEEDCYGMAQTYTC